DCSEALDDGGDAVGLAVVDEQATERVDFDVREVCNRLPKHLHPLIQSEETGLVLVDEHGCDNLIEQLRRPLDDVEMAVRDRIEGSGAYNLGHVSDRTKALSPRTDVHAAQSGSPATRTVRGRVVRQQSGRQPA